MNINRVKRVWGCRINSDALDVVVFSLTLYFRLFHGALNAAGFRVNCLLSTFFFIFLLILSSVEHFEGFFFVKCLKCSSCTIKSNFSNQIDSATT